METMFDRLGDLLNETLEAGHVKFKKKEIADEIKPESTGNSFADEKTTPNVPPFETDTDDSSEESGDLKKRLRIINSDIERACRLLDITTSANPEDVKKAYKEKLKYFHPDRYANNKILQKIATDKTRMILDAYELLMKSF